MRVAAGVEVRGLLPGPAFNCAALASPASAQTWACWPALDVDETWSSVYPPLSSSSSGIHARSPERQGEACFYPSWRMAWLIGTYLPLFPAENSTKSRQLELTNVTSLSNFHTQKLCAHLRRSSRGGMLGWRQCCQALRTSFWFRAGSLHRGGFDSSFEKLFNGSFGGVNSSFEHGRCH